MAAKRKAGKKDKGRPIRPKKAPKDIVLLTMGRDIKQDIKSKMFGESADAKKSKLVKLVEDPDGIRPYMENLVLKCTKCDKRFDHAAKLKPITYELRCPYCNEMHVLTFNPTSMLFKVDSTTLDLIDPDEQ